MSHDTTRHDTTRHDTTRHDTTHSAFLDTLLEKGYTILCVRGSLPERPRGAHPGSPNWVAAKRGQRPAAQLSEEEQLMQAIAASLAGPESGAPPAAAVHSAPSTPVLQQQLPPLIIDDEGDEDDELKQAIAMSLVHLRHRLLHYHVGTALVTLTLVVLLVACCPSQAEHGQAK